MIAAGNRRISVVIRYTICSAPFPKHPKLHPHQSAHHPQTSEIQCN